MTSIPPDILYDFVSACRRVSAHGLQQCSSGNLSRRLDAEHMMVSASRSWLERMDTSRVALCRLEDAQSVNGVRPSVESVFHAGVLRNRPDAEVVLHVQTPAATSVACSDCSADDFFVLPEIACYIGRVGVIEYITPGTPELAERVVEMLTDANLAVLKNHGQVVVGRGYDDAIEKAVFFELACEILLRTDGRARRLPSEEIERLRPDGKNPAGV